MLTSSRALLPIGIFDSGVGGLSVLRQLLHLLPHEDMVYLADTAWSPYGERSSAEIEQRSLQITRYLIAQHHIKALVVACNTATAHAVQTLRQTWPELPLIGIEPALKPATQISRTGHIGIMATRATVQSAKFQQLLHTWRGTCQVQVQACNGLALAIENALDGQTNPDGETCQSPCPRDIAAMRPCAQAHAAGSTPTSDAAEKASEKAPKSACAANQTQPAGIDTLVLGCTHYPFAAHTIKQLVGKHVQLIEPGEPVARHTRRLLEQAQLLRNGPHMAQLTLLATARPQRLAQAAHIWLGLPQAKAQAAEVLIEQHYTT